MTDQAIAVPNGSRSPAILKPEQVEAARANASRAASPRGKCLRHWTAFVLWCQEAGHRPLPVEPAVVAVHLFALAAAGTVPRTLALRMAAIGYAHRQAGEVPPHKLRSGTVTLDILAGARRSWGKPPARIGASRKTSCRSASASFSSCTTPADAAKSCSAPSSQAWLHDEPVATPEPIKSPR